MDAAFTHTADGKLTFARDAAGALFLDDLAAYAVLSTMCAERGRYAFDSGVGTLLSTVTKDGRATASRLSACASDALEQCHQDQLVRAGATYRVDRARSGAFLVGLTWHSPTGKAVAQTVRRCP